MIGKVVIAMNPFANVERLYTDSEMSDYRKKKSESLLPHLYLIGNFILYFLLISKANVQLCSIKATKLLMACI